MQTFEIPVLSGLAGAAVLFTGRGTHARPEPASLVGLLGLPDKGPVPLAIVRQVHSARCLVVTRQNLPAQAIVHVVGEADALATSERGVALGVATADCVPLVAVDPEARALAVIHAGWRGTLAGVLPAAISAMRLQLGAAPERIRIGAGPAAGPCCYEVGPDVLQPFMTQRPEIASLVISRVSDGRGKLDLVEANRLEALDAGIAPGHFGSTGVCTICRPDVCHSYRRDGAAAGRMWLLAALTR